jgi:hypothetical protein
MKLVDNYIRYRATIECRSHSTGAAGFLTALDAYEYVAQMDDLTNVEVAGIKIERYFLKTDITGDFQRK